MNRYLERCTPEELAAGLVYDEAQQRYECLACGAKFEQGEIYQIEGRFFEAERAVRQHVRGLHPDWFERLLELDSRYNSFTQRQRELALLLREGCGDAEIARQFGTSAATVRTQRFALREKAKQARHFLAVYSGLPDKRQPGEANILPGDKGEVMLEKYGMTQAEYDKILANAFISLTPLRLARLPAKEKKRVTIVDRIAREFEAGRSYSEGEVNEILGAIHEDYASLRRYLIVYGYMDRERDGSKYWLK